MSSTVWVNVGQCGNQVGLELWKHLVSDHGDSQSIMEGTNPFFNLDGTARCVMVDSEPKVIQYAQQKFKQYHNPNNLQQVTPKLRDSNLHWEQSGRGNNWAMGYYGPQGTEGGEDSLCEKAVQSVRREAERCDTYTGSVLTHSISGGTGSGLGCRLLEALRDRFPNRYLTSLIITPLLSGETPCQHYNSVLTMSFVRLPRSTQKYP